uniref:ENY2 transcription and export complex 2 subunit n=1 Tax=Cyclopterus lumpus TaxID=8103 RepID=A0A8C2XCJ2_CYCLU
MSKDSQMRAAINQKLIETGERERLKELLRAKLVECGWKDQLKAHCKDSDYFVKFDFKTNLLFYASLFLLTIGQRLLRP